MRDFVNHTDKRVNYLRAAKKINKLIKIKHKEPFCKLVKPLTNVHSYVTLQNI